MASITELKNRKTNPFRAQFKRKGYGGVLVKYFPTREEAQTWCDKIEADYKNKLLGEKPTRDPKSDLTIGMMLRRYMKEATPDKASALTETKDLQNFLAWRDMETRKIFPFDRYDAKEYIKYLENDYVWKGKPYIHHKTGKLVTPDRAPKKLRPAAIKRTISVMHRAWSYAAEEWRDYQGLENPWYKTRPKGKIKKRTRRPTKEELDKLADACNGCKGDYKEYSLLTIDLAIETGMRLQEIFNLDWRDVHIERRRIHIRKSKTDYKKDVDGRWIVLTIAAMYTLAFLYVYRERPKEGRIFPMNKFAFKQMWGDIVRRAGIPFKDKDYKQPHTGLTIHRDDVGLTFHDLRREASSRFKRCLFLDEIGMMLGHGDKTVTECYLEYDDDDLTAIQHKLDRYKIDGRTDGGGRTFEDLCEGRLGKDFTIFDLAEYDLRERVRARMHDPEYLKQHNPKLFEYVKERGLLKETPTDPKATILSNILQFKQGSK